MSNILRRAALLAVLASATAQGSWWNLVNEDFGPSATNRWTYAGVSNTQGQALFRLDATSGVVQAEWDQTNSIAAGNPYTIRPSRLLTPLPHPLTDRDTFRLRATLVMATNTLNETIEYHQIANVGLYHAEAMGADRAMSDNFDMGALIKVKDGSDFVEFNYFAGDDSSSAFYPFSRSAEMTIGAHTEQLGDYHFNYEFYEDLWDQSTAMGAGGRLPEETKIYLDLVYYGAATNDTARRGYMALYTDEARTQILQVGTQHMFYWTWPLPVDRTFTVTHAGFYNHVNLVYAGDPVRAVGTFDDLQVEQGFADAEVASARMSPDGVILEWASETGGTYHVVTSDNLMDGLWTTQAVVNAGSAFTALTNDWSGAVKIWRVERNDLP